MSSHVSSSASSRFILCMASVGDEVPEPLFVGRADGTVEKYISAVDADIGLPSLIIHGHKAAVTGIAAISPDEVVSCSLDGTVRRWSTDIELAEGMPRQTERFELHVPLRCIAVREERIYVGAANGFLHVIGGGQHSAWPGHLDVLSCIAFTAGGLVVTGGYDHQVRVWDPARGTTTCLFVGHTNKINGVAVVSGSAADGAGGEDEVVLTFSSDVTLKVWPVPDVAETEEEDTQPETGATRNQIVSFQVPDAKVPAEAAAASEADTHATSVAASTNSAGEGPADAVATTEKVLDEILNGAGGVAKPALKVREPYFPRCVPPLGTIELPDTPLSVCSSELSGLLLVGGAAGDVFALHAQKFAKAVLRFVARNRAMVRREVRQTNLTFKRSVTLAGKQCRHVIRTEEQRMLKIARRALKEKRAALREEQRAARAARRRDQQQQNEDDANEDGSDVEREDDMSQSADAEEAEEEEEEADEESGQRSAEGSEAGERDPLSILSEEQRTELAAFKSMKDEERDTRIKSLRASVQRHLAEVEPLATSTYDSKREQFSRLFFTSHIKAGSEAVKAMVISATSGDVYLTQADAVVPMKVTFGVQPI